MGATGLAVRGLRRELSAAGCKIRTLVVGLVVDGHVMGSVISGFQPSWTVLDEVTAKRIDLNLKHIVLDYICFT